MSITVSLYAQDIIFVTPDTIDPVLSGVVKMSVLKAGCVAKSIRVELRGTANVHGYVWIMNDEARSRSKTEVMAITDRDLSFGYETSTTLRKTLELELDSAEGRQALELGDHTFSFAFTIPSDTACWQGCQWGRIRHQCESGCDKELEWPGGA